MLIEHEYSPIKNNVDYPYGPPSKLPKPLRKFFARMDDFHQRALYAVLVKPLESGMVMGFEEIRKHTDSFLLKEQANVYSELPFIPSREHTTSFWDVSPILAYPEGCCLPITLSAVFTVNDFPTRYFINLRVLKLLGGKIHRSWGSYTDNNGKQYFQNFIRIADHILDVSHDEMSKDPNQKVRFEPISSGRYQNFSTIEEMITASESYEKDIVCHSSISVFWPFAFFSPLCAVHTESRYASNRGYFPQGSMENVATFLERNDRPAPPDVRERLKKVVETMLSSGDFPEGFKNPLEQILDVLSLKEPEVVSKIPEYLKRAQTWIKNASENEKVTPHQSYQKFCEMINEITSTIYLHYEAMNQKERFKKMNLLLSVDSDGKEVWMQRRD